MGMYDELYIEAAELLPDADVPAGATFETKAFPHPFLAKYTITKVGRLIDACGRDLECDGYLEFYHYYHHLEPPVGEGRLAEYRAHFCRGQLDNIVRVNEEPEGEWTDKVIYGLAAYRIFALAAPQSFVIDIGEDVAALQASPTHAAKLRSDALGTFIGDYEAKHGALTPDELARASSEFLQNDANDKSGA